MSGKGADRKIDYIEFNVADIARSKAFYGNAFGWTFTDYGPDYCEFQDGRLTGGFTTLAPVSSRRAISSASQSGRAVSSSSIKASQGAVAAFRQALRATEMFRAGA